MTTRDAERNEKVAPFLRLARVMACTICGVNPAGAQASAVLQPDAAEDHWRVSGVCDACAGGLRKRDIIDAVRQSG